MFNLTIDINIEKTKSMHACRPQSQIARAAISFSVFEKEIEGVRHFKYLGVTSSNFTWTEHIGFVSKRINQCLEFYGGLRVCFHVVRLLQQSYSPDL